MKTRFDGTHWIAAFGVVLDIKEMDTAHLLNTVKMLVQKPARVQAMLVDDIESATFADSSVWSPVSREDDRKQSINNVTSLSTEEITKYVTGTTLFKAMLSELESRGVNTENILHLYMEDAAFSK